MRHTKTRKMKILLRLKIKKKKKQPKNKKNDGRRRKRDRLDVTTSVYTYYISTIFFLLCVYICCFIQTPYTLSIELSSFHEE